MLEVQAASWHTILTLLLESLESTGATFECCETSLQDKHVLHSCSITAPVNSIFDGSDIGALGEPQGSCSFAAGDFEPSWMPL